MGNIVKKFGIHEMVDEMKLQTRHNTMGNSGIGHGQYDQNHKILRKRWYEATTKLLSNDGLNELVDFSARQIVENLELEMAKNEAGIDPKRTFMSGSLNVATSFMLNERFDFNDYEQVMIMNWIEVRLCIIQISNHDFRLFSTSLSIFSLETFGRLYSPSG